LLLLLIALSFFIKNPWLIRLRNFLAWFGIALLILACAPLPWWMYAAATTAYLFWFIAWNLGSARKQIAKWRTVSAVLCAIVIIVFTVTQLPYRSSPTISGPPTDHLVIVGDSISAGIDGGYDPWPIVFQHETGTHVLNLSRPGIGVEEAIPLAKKVSPNDKLILLEIGGNDLLSSLSADKFREQLNVLLASLATDGRTLVMFELPLLPHKIEFGCVQRDLAEKYHVALIPKRLFIDVLSSSDATSDGLHLSAPGTKRMAALVRTILSAVLRPSVSP
jgi:acyl-CoA thioesterase-1